MEPQTNWRATLADNLAQVRAEMAQAAARAGRSAADVRLVAVTKYVELPVLRALLDLGVQDLGENRVQQLTQRAAALASDPAARPRWHMIGHLQRNKVRALLGACRMIHSLDSRRLADELEVEAQRSGRDVDVLIEVNVSGEQSKQGLTESAVGDLCEHLGRLSRLRLRGLMTMAPLVDDPQRVRPCFAKLRELLWELRRRGVVEADCRELSMGMTQDYVQAIEEGATLVRVGSALFRNVAATE